MKCFLAAVVLACSCSLNAAEIKPRRHWDGKISPKTMKGTDPTPIPPSVPDRCIRDAKTWEKVWKALRGAEPVGKVDFDKELVLVATIGTNDKILITDIQLNERGALTYSTISTKEGGEGFSYTLVVVPSVGVKSVEGR